MARMLRALLIASLLLGASPSAFAQQGDAAYFESIEGLQRVVARAWMAPVTMVESSSVVEINAEGTPIGTPVVSTPSATPQPHPGIGGLNVFVYLFDSDANAEAGFERLDGDLELTVLRDPRAPMMDDLPLDDIGDDARGYMGDLNIEGVAITYTFATVLDGPFVYSLSGMFPGGTTGVDSAALTAGYAEALVRTPMNRMAEQFHDDGTSRGGIWSKLNAIEPDLPEGSSVVDFVIWPMPEGQADAGTTITTMDDLEAVEGVERIDGITYLPGAGAPERGPERIDAWIIETDSPQQAAMLIYVIAGILGDPIAVLASENAIEGEGDEIETMIAQEGFVTDDTRPDGNGALVLQQSGPTIYGAIVYTPDETARRIADNVVETMMGTPAGSDATDRFPQEGDGVLRDLIPAGSPEATPATSNRRTTM
jgi:hypothetical protein